VLERLRTGDTLVLAPESQLTRPLADLAGEPPTTRGGRRLRDRIAACDPAESSTKARIDLELGLHQAHGPPVLPVFVGSED